MNSLLIQGISKKFFKEKELVNALHPVSFEVGQGELF